MAEGLDLGKQVGPLPLGGWIAVVAGGLGIAYFINRNQTSNEAVQLTESGTGTGGGQFVYEPPQEGQQPLEENNNDAWGRKATNWLIGRGNPPGLADNAIRKYLSSEELDAQEQALVDQALVEFGAPPEPLAPVREIEHPPEPPAKPKKMVIYRQLALNSVVVTLADPQGGADAPTHLNLKITGSNGYHFSVNITTIPGYGLDYRYVHIRPPNSAGVAYKYVATPYNDDLAGPPIIATGVHFNRYGYSPPVYGK